MKELVMDEAEIKETCSRLGGELTERLKKEDRLPLFIGVMDGAVEFMSDLIRFVKVPLLVDYVKVQSWEGTHNTGTVRIVRDCQSNLSGRTVVVVDDIVETGKSMELLLARLREMGRPKRIITVALFDKPFARKTSLRIDLCGRSLDKRQFLMGYGFDYKGLNRNIPYVYVPTDEEIEEMERQVSK
ncbi:MAG: hypoxanthine phosphoribosyltransferase [Bacilli bacterium]|jgi:hypoxanthine phosphoribosyltransferase|nr:hypoxanthine phosphoribosyltransferase [Bacilli bacterium]